MTHRTSRTTVPSVAGVDLSFRPASYWDVADPVAAVLQNIKGQRRREINAEYLLGRTPADYGTIEDVYLQDELPALRRRTLNRMHPVNAGGEFLPSYLSGEVEIARMILANFTRDVLSFRARRRRGGARILYRVVDEYEVAYVSLHRSSRAPLTLAELVEMIDSADDGCPDFGLPLPEEIVTHELNQSGEAEHDASFVSVQSVVYPALEQYYRVRLLEWVTSQGGKGSEESA